MKIAVVGGSGFIGSALCKRLNSVDNIDINIVDKHRSQVYAEKTNIADIREKDQLEKALIDSEVIINLAAEHKDNVTPQSLYYDVNVEGVKNICDIARLKDIKKIIFTSSVAVYGFAPVGTDENGKINPFNEYGRTKWKAEEVLRSWQSEDPTSRSLVIIRPTVVFGERNRGNVYNLLRQIASGRFVMIGNGRNRKSMAYVENVSAFIEFSLSFAPGVHIFNYIDKPDFDMNSLVILCRNVLLSKKGVGIRIPFAVGLFVGWFFDLMSIILKKEFPISSIRVRKFCADSSFSTTIDSTGFIRPYRIEEAIESTLKYEFLEDNTNQPVYFSE